MTSGSSEKLTLSSWLKALLLSPGILFLFVYLAIYLSTTIYLNLDFKKNLLHNLSIPGNTPYHISIGSINAGFVMDSVILHEIELSPATPTGLHGSGGKPVTIPKLRVTCPGLEKLLFTPGMVNASTRKLCSGILDAAKQHQ
ncbi:MAG: hypothetical protein HGA72_01505 [Chlorobiaceae bacterium]|jgi:hypothetical protein|nr:hypothetical protein [Chlorobiaceae bacterium]NTW62661.1 hypothetical protein [Chlorobiaceae bacterium]